MKADRKERFVELGTELVGIIADALFTVKETFVTETKKTETKVGDAKKTEIKKTETKTTEIKATETKAAPKGKAFTVSNPAKEPADVKMFKEQWKALGPKQNDYLDGKIDSLGNALESEIADEPQSETVEEDYENFDTGEETETTIEQVREAFKNLAQAKTSAECTNVLKAFSVKKISEIKKEDFAKILAKVQAAINA